MKQTAVFGGGCFWCTEAIFRQLKGVLDVMPGYAGGTKPDPTYEEVCSGATGHTEVIKIDFDSSRISYEDLLTVFFATHDPTTPNRQGNDVGSQYRSAILTTTDEQQEKAPAFIRHLNESSSEGAPIVTEIKPLDHFWPAEEYHRQYYEKNKTAPYCQLVINPKLAILQKRFAELIEHQS